MLEALTILTIFVLVSYKTVSYKNHLELEASPVLGSPLFFIELDLTNIKQNVDK